MACNGTYLGDCCEPPPACAAHTSLSDSLTLLLPLTWDTTPRKCGYPDTGFLAWRYTARVTIIENRFDANEECKGEWNGTVIRTVEASGAKCPTYTEQCQTLGNVDFILNGGCGWMSAFGCIQVEPKNADTWPIRDEPDYFVADDVANRTRTYRYQGVAGDEASCIIEEMIELLGPFDIAAWVASCLQALVDNHVTGKRTVMQGRCDGGLDKTITDLTGEVGAPSAASVRVDAGAGGVVFTGDHTSYRDTRPYCLRERQDPSSTCPEVNNCTTYPKLQPPEVPEVDCVDLLPAPNRTLSKVNCPC